MTEIINKTNEFVKTNIRWLGVVLIGLLGLWADSRYPSISEFNKLKKEHETSEREVLLYKQRLETLEGRFEKKLKITNKHTEEINENENDIIRLQEQIKNK